jgi:hypothetical protein
MRRAWYLPLILLCLGITGYVAASRLTFAAPTLVSQTTDTNDCGFNPADFTATGNLRFSEGQAWWVSFLRKQEYFSALSIGLLVAFVGFAVTKVRQIGTAAAAGAVAGSSILGVLALCLGCLAPTLSAIGLGLVGTLTLPIPKWLMTLSTLVLTIWGTVFLSKRSTTCPVSLSSHSSTVVAKGAKTTSIGVEP